MRLSSEVLAQFLFSISFIHLLSLILDHPRLRGEHLLDLVVLLVVVGSPPPKRGTHICLTYSHTQARITPAYAGNTCILYVFGLILHQLAYVFRRRSQSALYILCRLPCQPYNVFCACLVPLTDWSPMKSVSVS